MEVILKITKQINGLTRTLLLYRLIQLFSLPFVFFYLATRLLMRRGYAAHFTERLGFLSRSFRTNSARSIWLHAVSVGEVTSLVPLLRLLRIRFPEAPLYLSTSTVAGRQVAERQAASLVQGIFYLPFDYGFCLRRAFRTVRPALLVVIETELWPNLFALAHYSGTSLAIINGRISHRTWPTYRKWKTLFASLLQIPDLVQVQGKVDRARYAELGASTSSLLVDGNLKFDATVPALSSTLPTFGAQQIWVAASTVGPNERGSMRAHSVDEDDLVLSTFQQLATEFPRLLLILAPRQPARFQQATSKLASLQLNFQKRSTMQGDLALPGVLLLDTMGELASLYSLANAVFVGGSIAPRGGHNIIEPAVAGVPIVIGPNMQNFEAITRSFLEAKAVVQIEKADELTPAIRSLLLDRHRSRLLGERAREVVKAQRGVSERALERLTPLYLTGSFRRPHSLAVQLLLNGLAWLWTVGGDFKRERGRQVSTKRGPLPVPVVSIGGLAIGGTGKTPFALALTKLLLVSGAHPGILTRGYRRRSKGVVVASPGAALPSRETGDEAQIFLRAKLAPVGIGSDRYLSGLSLLEQFPSTDVLLLDDGFQHASLPRALDIVLIDGLDPFGNGQVLPAGGLREAPEALGRAQIAVVTRCPCLDRYTAIANQIRSYNATIEVFQSDTVTEPWRSAASRKEVVISPARKAVAFCGLGNPHSFWQSLATAGINTVLRKTFRDHHRYTLGELEKLADSARRMGADLLLTTEKDFFNLPKEIPGIEVLYLPIEFTVRDQERLLELIQRAL